MTLLHQSAQHILQADTRYVISRSDWRWPVTVASTLFPFDPSSHKSDLVWKEDVAHLMRRQPQIAGPDGSVPVVNYLMEGTRQWDINVRMSKLINAVLEDGDADPAIMPRQRRLRNALLKARLEREIQTCQVTLDPAILTQNVTLVAGERFDDIYSAASDPIAVLRDGCFKVKLATGLKVKHCIIPEAGLLQLCRHESVMRQAVNKLNLTAERLVINNNIIERLIDDSLIEPGAIKSYEMWFNNTPDGPSSTVQMSRVYPMGNCVLLAAEAKPGGTGGNDYGFGLMKFWDLIKVAFPNDPDVQVATGNEGFGVFSYPWMEGAGGDQSYLVNAAVPFVQNPEAAYAIYGAFDAANTKLYGDLFTTY